jgi:hypothetical protein
VNSELDKTWGQRQEVAMTWNDLPDPMAKILSAVKCGEISKQPSPLPRSMMIDRSRGRLAFDLRNGQRASRETLAHVAMDVQSRMILGCVIETNAA